jgi:deferrochelatase/peroxidase EfeB
VLGGLAAAALPLAAPAAASTLLAGCMLRGDDDTGGSVSHPALQAPREEAVVAVVAVPQEPALARTVLATLAARVRAVRRAGGTTSAMLAVGPTWFTKAGLGDRKPPQVTTMPVFEGDRLDPLRFGGDLLLQVEGDTRPEVDRAATEMLAGLVGAVVRWRTAGSRPENEVVDGRALTRNVAGFVEGLGNPDSRDGATVDGMTLIRSGSGVPEWAVGGTYLVLRVIRLDRDAWASEAPAEQESIIGRRTDGRWLDGTPADGDPDFGSDQYGLRTPVDAHVRRANPRREGESPPPLVRRSWSWSGGPRADGAREEGTLFMCYQADIGAGYEAVQKRLKGQLLDLYVTAIGGGYFVVPPPDPAGAAWETALLR